MPTKSKSTTPRKARNNKKTTTASVPEPVVVAAPEPVVETAPVVAETATPEISLEDQFKDIITRLQQFRTLSQTLMADVRKLQKNVNRQVRESSKKNKKRKNTGDSKRPPSGFAKPGPVSDELRKFLGLSKEELISRTQVTKRITLYCKEHSLQQEEDKRNINPNAALTKLLRWKQGVDDPVTFFNLQKYMKVHYPNKEGVYA